MDVLSFPPDFDCHHQLLLKVLKRKRQNDAAASGSSTMTLTTLHRVMTSLPSSSFIFLTLLLVTSSTISPVHSLSLLLNRSNNNRRILSSSTIFGNSLVCPSSSYLPSSSSQNYLTMRVSGTNSRNRDSKSSILIETNNDRLRNAGRPGTSNFIDPTKLFIGNLPFTANEDDIKCSLARHWNTQRVDERIQSIKIVRDWKTGLSKGYGFIQFYDAMAATSAIVDINTNSKTGGGLIVGGRKVRLDQGKRKPNENDPKELKRKEKEERKKKKLLAVNELDEEGRVIYSALSGNYNIDDDIMMIMDVESGIKENSTQGKEKGGSMSEDDMIAFMERGGLRGAMALTEETAGYLGTKGLYVDDDTTSDDDDDDDDENTNTLDYEKYYNENGYRDTDYSDDIDDINVDDDNLEGDDGIELVYDGVFEEMYNPNEYESLTDEEAEEYAKMNREQRRAAEKKRKKRKLPFRGFGKDTPNGSISMD